MNTYTRWIGGEWKLLWTWNKIIVKLRTLYWWHWGFCRRGKLISRMPLGWRRWLAIRMAALRATFRDNFSIMTMWWRWERLGRLRGISLWRDDKRTRRGTSRNNIHRVCTNASNSSTSKGWIRNLCFWNIVWWTWLTSGFLFRLLGGILGIFSNSDTGELELEMVYRTPCSPKILSSGVETMFPG